MSQRRTVVIDPNELPKHLDTSTVELKWAGVWQAQGVYSYAGSAPRLQTFVIDTPPPTVSGSLHVGHVFSYTHADVIARHQRMLGKDVFYPMGWDDNGLPTERRVQNAFNVRVDVEAAHDPALLTRLRDGGPRPERPVPVSRPDFIELCHEVTAQDEAAFEELFRRVGLSVDWSQKYRTIDRECRRMAQLSFWDLHQKGHIYSTVAPTLWDVDFQTAVALAEVEERTIGGAYHDLTFGVEGGTESFVVSTTRPELLPACVGVAVHPEDPRYRSLLGRTAVTPLFVVPVPIFASDLVDPAKGTGVVMVCTFGDATDVQWWRDQRLALRPIVGRDGRMVVVQFGAEGWETRDPARANAAFAALIGKSTSQAQKLIVELLRAPGSAVSGEGSALADRPPRPTERAVKFFEKGDRPLELMVARQWFVRLVDKKADLLRKGEEIGWHPSFMAHRYRQWTEGLASDWCISRQRYFGVPFPVWYPLDAQGAPDHERAIVAAPDELPVDPTTDVPPGYQGSQRGVPGGFVAERDVFDTWFTSSLTPFISSRWRLDPERHARLHPADIRPQSHEIIRTWAFYTIAKSMLHEGLIPWRDIVISGWILDPDRKKMSKSKGNVVTPLHLVTEYGADAVRYWAASARLGVDTAFDVKVLAVGRRLVVKLFNAAKYVLSQTGGDESSAITEELDRAFIASLGSLIDRASEKFDQFAYSEALDETERFFWTAFTDTYLELSKSRARGDGATTGAQRASAIATLRVGLNVLLRLLAPFLPFVTEEIWSWAFAAETGVPSIHRAPWPRREELAQTPAPRDPLLLELASTFLATLNRAKTEQGASAGRVVTELGLEANEATLGRLTRGITDFMAAVRCQHWTTAVVADCLEGQFKVRHMALAPKKDDQPG
jgi:valyl-tRNA synthetase